MSWLPIAARRDATDTRDGEVDVRAIDNDADGSWQSAALISSRCFQAPKRRAPRADPRMRRLLSRVRRSRTSKFRERGRAGVDPVAFDG
jgi:hypothetical protein